MISQSFRKFIGITDLKLEWSPVLNRPELFMCKTYEVTELRNTAGSTIPAIVNKQSLEHIWEVVPYGLPKAE